MKQFIFGFIAALGLIVVGGYAYLALGLAPVATAAPPLPFEKRMTSIASKPRIDKEAPKSSPVSGSDAVNAGEAKIYRDHCAVCHGLPGQEQTAIATGKFPTPRELLKLKGVTDDPVGETYWKVANGIRLTGMPGFSDSLSTEQMWQV